MNNERFGKYSNEIGATASCVKRGIKATQYSGSGVEIERNEALKQKNGEIFNGDSWFTGIRAARAAANEGSEYFGPVKTSTGGFPLDEVTKIMADWPAGSHLVLECREHKLFAVGYKYSLRSKGECGGIQV